MARFERISTNIIPYVRTSLSTMPCRIKSYTPALQLDLPPSLTERRRPVGPFPARALA